MTEIERWLAAVTGPPLPQRLVPGASTDERRRLAAMGGLVHRLVGRVPATWPTQLRDWAREAPSPPAAVVAEARKRLEDPNDFFADLYESVVAGPNRRRLGTFFTPPEVVELMLERSAAVLPDPEVVVDPGAGVGAFSVSAAKWWPDATVQAVDVNLVTLGLLAARLALDGQTGQVELVHADFLRWVQDDQPSGPRLFLGNPPYTRHQELDRATKTRARKAAGSLVDSGLSGLAAYFLAASIEHLRAEDALCFVLPGSWTEARHGSKLRRWLWMQTRRPIELLAFPSDMEIFPGTRVNAVIAAVGPQSHSASKFTTAPITPRASRLIVGKRATVDRRGDLPASFGPLLWGGDHLAPKGTVDLSSLGQIRRGVATGANHWFFLTDEEAAPLPSRLLRPGVRRLREVEGTVLDQAEHERLGEAGRRRWLLSLTGPADCRSAAVQSLLADGEAEGFDGRYLTRIREHWYVVESATAPDIILSLMSKDGFRAVANPVGAIPSNSMYGIHLDDPSLAARLCQWLNSPAGQAAIRARARHYSDGLLKLEPRDYRDVRIPATLFR